MRAASPRRDEAERLEALRRFEVLDTPAELLFDELAQLAAQLCATPTAVITLIDSERQWFKSRVGFTALETHRDLPFCAHSILGRDLLIVPDTLRDPRFADDPMVTGPPAIRFYAGAPLTTSEGYAIGTLAVIDYVPRELDDRQQQGLRALSHQVIAQLELRRRLIVEQRQLEERTEDTEAQKRSLLDAALDAIVAIDHLGRIIEFNPAAEKTFGHRRADVLGKEMASLIIPPAQREQHRRGLARFLATGHGRMLGRHVELTAVRANGVEIPVELAIVRLGKGSPPMFAGFLRDLTEQKRTEELKRQSEKRYGELVEGVRDAIFTISRDGKITSANQASETILGWPRAHWIGREFLPHVDVGDRSFALQMFQRALSGERPPPFVLRLSTRAGESVGLELTVSAQLARDQIVGILGVARDITERQQLEAQVRQAQKMEALGHLAGGIAHDFNNLLTVIQCSAMMLDAHTTPAQLKEHADAIVGATELATGLTRQLLMVSRKQPLQVTDVDVNRVVAAMTKLLGRILGDSVTLHATYASDLPRVRADVGMLEQVVLNFVVNARDAMPGGGQLTIRTGEEIVRERRMLHGLEVSPGRYVGVSVADTGSGIPPDVLPRIFEPFFTTKEVGRGTGLGLATVYAIVRQHRGGIDVASEVGKGATFRIYLPVENA